MAAESADGALGANSILAAVDLGWRMAELYGQVKPEDLDPPKLPPTNRCQPFLHLRQSGGFNCKPIFRVSVNLASLRSLDCS